MTIDGFVNLDKPRGETSFQMVSLFRRLSGQRRVGHAGTLDPEATGVLPICLGQATRLVEFIQGRSKEYRAQFEFGKATDTYDGAGSVVQTGDPSVLTLGQIEDALCQFKGTLQQLPPMYSAAKHRGRPLYAWARAGIEVPRKPKTVEISTLDLMDWLSPILTLHIECSTGTYVRSLAHDLGQALGCGAYLKALVRLRSGPFRIEDSATVSEVTRTLDQGSWADVLRPMDFAVQHLPELHVDDNDEAAIKNGRSPAAQPEADPAMRHCRAYSAGGRLIAILRYDPAQGLWTPDRVLAAQYKSITNLDI